MLCAAQPIHLLRRKNVHQALHLLDDMIQVASIHLTYNFHNLSITHIMHKLSLDHPRRYISSYRHPSLQ